MIEASPTPTAVRFGRYGAYPTHSNDHQNTILSKTKFSPVTVVKKGQNPRLIREFHRHGQEFQQREADDRCKRHCAVPSNLNTSCGQEQDKERTQKQAIGDHSHSKDVDLPTGQFARRISDSEASRRSRSSTTLELQTTASLDSGAGHQGRSLPQMPGSAAPP